RSEQSAVARLGSGARPSRSGEGALPQAPWAGRVVAWATTPDGWPGRRAMPKATRALPASFQGRAFPGVGIAALVQMRGSRGSGSPRLYKCVVPGDGDRHACTNAWFRAVG